MVNKNIPTSYSQALEMMKGKDSKSIPSIRSTSLNRIGENKIAMYYHDTPVAIYHQNGNIELFSGGYKTRTTKERMNQALRHKSVKVYQYKYEWYLHSFDGNVIQPFSDGMII